MNINTSIYIQNRTNIYKAHAHAHTHTHTAICVLVECELFEDVTAVTSLCERDGVVV